jgi:hypothetical protein
MAHCTKSYGTSDLIVISSKFTALLINSTASKILLTPLTPAENV